ncbi:EFR1 family ferrodoxin [Anaerovorax odorimutans]|uniref:EFR1 family ferrodoxin n=1 Tax=Anaerovorax odorimutans TaxID=109327 RepID=A0ABT1RNE5_9FIRM|nr:EFR1 family ferrodoxin [Anaerovorax odorimutans]MCQ4636704.1 EFR1 family ferrodoxin [Anaerovorax odorimutans]
MKRVIVMYFSPTGTSGKIAGAIAGGISQAMDCQLETIDLTEPEVRDREYSFSDQDILVLGYPVYAGRVPEVLQAPLRRVKGNGTSAVLAAVYGNRDYEDALIEGQDILTEGGFSVIGAGAFIGEHSYSKKVAAGRPDGEDLACAKRFGEQISDKLKNSQLAAIEVKGNRPYKDPMPDMPFLPKTTDACTDCGICADKCPMQVIHRDDPRIVDQGCILCSACVKSCPVDAKYIAAEPIVKIRGMLETKFMDRKEPELFL